LSCIVAEIEWKLGDSSPLKIILLNSSKFQDSLGFRFPGISDEFPEFPRFRACYGWVSVLALKSSTKYYPEMKVQGAKCGE
jgi:hypothetical protein